jgi:hypothetical protein
MRQESQFLRQAVTSTDDYDIGVLLRYTNDNKTSKEPMHLDLETDDVEAEVRCLESLGAPAGTTSRNAPTTAGYSATRGATSYWPIVLPGTRRARIRNENAPRIRSGLVMPAHAAADQSATRRCTAPSCRPPRAPAHRNRGCTASTFGVKATNLDDMNSTVPASQLTRRRPLPAPSSLKHHPNRAAPSASRRCPNHPPTHPPPPGGDASTMSKQAAASRLRGGAGIGRGWPALLCNLNTRFTRRG